MASTLLLSILAGLLSSVPVYAMQQARMASEDFDLWQNMDSGVFGLGAETLPNDHLGQTLLYQASSRRNPEDARALLAADPESEGQTASPEVGLNVTVGWTALHYAASRGQIERVRQLLSADADVKAVTNDVRTPLHLAIGAEKNNKDVVRELLSQGADPLALDRNGDSPLKLAKKLCDSQPPAVDTKKKSPCEKIVELLVCRTPLVTAARIKEALLEKNTKTCAVPRDVVEEIICMLIVDAVHAAINSLEKEPALTSTKAQPLTEEEVKTLFADNGSEGLTFVRKLIEKVNNSCILHRAIRRGNVFAAERLLFAGADIHTETETEAKNGYFDFVQDEWNYPRTPLQIANHFNLTDIMRLLLKAAPLTDEDGGKLIIGACNYFRDEFDNSQLLKLLFLAGADLGAAASLDDGNGWCELCNAYQGDDSNPAEKVLRKRKVLKKASLAAFLEHFAYRAGEAPHNGSHLSRCLFRCGRGGECKECKCIIYGIQWLLDQGKVDLDTFGQFGDGCNVLLEAAKVGFYGLAQLVLQRGANPDAKKDNGVTALHLAAKCGKSSKAINGSHLADEVDTQGVVSLLLMAGADVNAVDSQGVTPLHLASRSDEPSIVSLLLNEEANVNAVNHEGKTPLHCAFEIAFKPSNREDVIRLLLMARANVNAVDNQGVTPLHQASHSLEPSIVSLFLSAGANVDAVNHEGKTPLHCAFQYDFFKHFERENVVRSLLMAGADVKVVDRQGVTPLHGAAGVDDVASASLLLEAGANVNAVNNEGKTPLDLARQPQLIQLLQEHAHKAIKPVLAAPLVEANTTNTEKQAARTLEIVELYENEPKRRITEQECYPMNVDN